MSNAVDGVKSTDKRPEGQQRKHWPKHNDAVEQWLTKKRNDKHAESPEWWTIQELLAEYQRYETTKQYLGATNE